MPTYEYSCRTCAQVFEVFQSMRDAPLTTCPKCGLATVKRLVGRGAGIIFKGSGFYETDYKRPPAKAEGADASGGGSTTATASGDTAKAAPASAGSTSSPSAGATPAKPAGGT